MTETTGHLALVTNDDSYLDSLSEPEDFAAPVMAAVGPARGHVTGGSPSEGADWPTIPVEEIFAPLPPINWLCQDLGLAPGAPAVFGGYGFGGKTMSAQSMALSVACGAAIWGKFPVREGKVLHIDYEQGSHLTRLRYQRLARGMGMKPDAGRLELSALPPLYLDGEGSMDPLMRACEDKSLVIIDSLRASAPSVDENSSEVRKILDDLNRIAEKTGCLGLVIVHARKPSKEDVGGSAKYSIRGSSGIYDAAGSLYVLSGLAKNAPIKVSHEKSRIDGKLIDDFALTISDTDGGGLIVTAGGIPAKHSGESGGAAVEARKAEILEFLKDGPAASKNAIHARLKGNKQNHYAAIAELELDGSIVIGGRAGKNVVTRAAQEAAE